MEESNAWENVSISGVSLAKFRNLVTETQFPT